MVKICGKDFKGGKIVAFQDGDHLVVIYNDCKNPDDKNFYLQHWNIASKAREAGLVSPTARLLGGMEMRIEGGKIFTGEASSSISLCYLPSWVPWGQKIEEFSWEIQHLLNLEVARHFAKITGLPAFAEYPGDFPECPICRQREQDCHGH